MDVKMPDGTVVKNVPEDTTKAELARRYGLSQQAQPEPQQESPTLQQRAQDVYGFDPEIERRGTILPFGVTKEGETEFAVPQIGKDLLESFLLPGHVAKGGTYTPQDAAKFALDYAVPATSGRQLSPAAKAVKKAPTRKEFVAAAPSSRALSKQGGKMFEGARRSGDAVGGDDFLELMAKMESRAMDEGLDSMLHPKATASLRAIAKNIGKEEIDIPTLMTARRQLGIAQRSIAPELADERRIAGIMEDLLDDFVETQTAQGGRLAGARSLWQRAKKSQIIEEAIERSKEQASGVENGLRIQFRQVLDKIRKGKYRGFTDDEVGALKEVVEGKLSTKGLRLLGKMSFGTKGGTNFLGGTIGVGLGGAAGGPIGAMAAPAIGHAAQKGAEIATQRGADYTRALTATGGVAPQTSGRLTQNLMRAAPPVAGAIMPQQTAAQKQMELEEFLRQMKLGNAF